MCGCALGAVGDADIGAVGDADIGAVGDADIGAVEGHRGRAGRNEWARTHSPGNKRAERGRAALAQPDAMPGP